MFSNILQKIAPWHERHNNQGHILIKVESNEWHDIGVAEVDHEIDLFQ